VYSPWHTHIPQVSFCKRATNCRALLWNMTYRDKASYSSLPPCNASTQSPPTHAHTHTVYSPSHFTFSLTHSVYPTLYVLGIEKIPKWCDCAHAHAHARTHAHTQDTNTHAHTHMHMHAHTFNLHHALTLSPPNPTKLGSALDIFGGKTVRYADCVQWNHEQQTTK